MSLRDRRVFRLIVVVLRRRRAFLSLLRSFLELYKLERGDPIQRRSCRQPLAILPIGR